MNHRAKRGIHLFLFLAVSIVGALAIIALAFLSRTKTPPRITVTMDTNGVPRLAGVPLSNTNIRDSAFAAMSAMGVKGAFAVPPMAQCDPRVTNVINTLQSMTRAGFLGSVTNPGRAGPLSNTPSPYE